MSNFVTACPRNCYSTCGFRVSLRNGRIALIEPHPDNKATEKGVCLKGLSYAERVYHPDRLLFPLKKMNGDFQRISWDAAFSELETKIKSFRKEYGAKSILYYSGSGTKGLLNGVGGHFWKMIGGYTTTYGDLCWPAGLEATRLTLGENKHNAPWDLENARLIIMWGKNAAETNIHQMRFIDQAIAKGATFVVIDPRRSESVQRAHLHIRPRPGTDGVLALALANRLIARQAVNTNFIDAHVHGFREFCTLAERFSPEIAAKMTGVPAEEIIKLADHIGRIKPVTITAGYGMQRYSNSGQTMRAMLAVLAITGNIGKPGAGWVYANLQSHIFDEIKDPVAFYPPEKPDEKVRVSISTAKLGSDILKTADPPIKMIWVERGNPVTQNPDTNAVIKAFRSVDYRVVIDQFMTDTAREADLVLPAKTMFEQADVINAYWHPYIQYKQKIIDPPGEVKPETEIYYHLAKRFGFSEHELAGKIPATSDNAVEKYLRDKLQPFSGLTLERLQNGPCLAPGSEEIAFADLKFPTPSGKIELLSTEATMRWGVDPLPTFKAVDLPEDRQGHSFYLMTPNTKNRIHSQFNNLRLIRQFSQKPVIHIHPTDAQKLGIDEGQRVRIFNERGEMKAPASLDFGMMPGCIAVTNGWWISEGGTVNFLSPGKETDMGYGAAFHNNRVGLERV